MDIKKFKQISLNICMYLFAGMIIPVSAMASDVDIYAEGVINGTQLNVYVYMDINMDNLLTYGVSLNYDATELRVIQVQKDPEIIPYTSNKTKWDIEKSAVVHRNTPALHYSSPGEIIILGGKLDPGDTAQMVPRGERALLAVVMFGPANVDLPVSPILFLSYASEIGADAYKNFFRLANNVPQVLDGNDVYFGNVQVTRQGDADGNGSISFQDIHVIKSNIGNENAPCYIDCDGNGRVTMEDINCLKSKL